MLQNPSSSSFYPLLLCTMLLYTCELCKRNQHTRSEIPKKVNARGCYEQETCDDCMKKKHDPLEIMPEYRRLFTHIKNASLHRWADDAMVYSVR